MIIDLLLTEGFKTCLCIILCASIYITLELVQGDN